jgi:lipopolysaccharide assembly protein A
MSADRQPAPHGAPLPPRDAPLPRHVPGTEAPPPEETPVLPGAVYPAEEAAIPPEELVPPQSAVPPGPEQPAPAEPRTPVAPPLKIKRTRTSGLWVAVGFFAVVLLLLLIFILQNGAQVSVNYLGAHGHLPLGVALLLSAVCGVLLVVLAGAARISQLRAVARRHRRADARRAKAAARETR